MRNLAAAVGIVTAIAITLAWQFAPVHQRLERIDQLLIAVVERLAAVEAAVEMIQTFNPPPGGRPGDN